MLCYKCNSTIPDNSLVCPKCGAEMSVYARRTHESGEDANPFTSLIPMNWYRFLIKFSLYASAITSFINGILYLTGYIHTMQSGASTNAYMIYMQFGDGLMISDMVYGALSIVYALFGLMVRKRLALFKKNAPLLFYIWCAMGIIISTGYAIAIGIFGGVPNSFGAAFIPQIITEAVYIYINYIYFSKRKQFFVN